MKIIDINTWNRKAHYNHFSALADPYFSVTIAFDMTKSYAFAKAHNISFFGSYLHACMTAINQIEPLKYRIVDEQVLSYDTINASATLMRKDKTFGFSFIEYDENLEVFLKHLKQEQERIEQSDALYPPNNGLDCIHCSALPWLSFTGHKEPMSGTQDSVPKLAFGKVEKRGDERIMNLAISVNHALVDGYHIGLFSEQFQQNLNSNNFNNKTISQ